MKGSSIYRYFINKIILILGRHPAIIYGLALIYLIVPFDILPEAFTGLLGYLDDIFLLTLASLLMGKLKNHSVATPGKKSNLNPYQTLGISSNATEKEIKDAYRKKMAEYHPDKVAHLGEDLKKTATEKTRAIQQAYDQLMKK